VGIMLLFGWEERQIQEIIILFGMVEDDMAVGWLFKVVVQIR